MSSVIISGDTSGAITVSAPLVAGTNTITLAAQTGTLNAAGPAFSAWQSTNQATLAASTWTKLIFQTEEFDTASAFDSTTNYRFTPQVAGYYQVNGCWQAAGSSTMYINLYKNGTAYKSGTFATAITATISAMVFLNGSTDYIELFCQSSVTATFASSQSGTYFQACLVRGA
jgi:hypothetical protein